MYHVCPSGSPAWWNSIEPIVASTPLARFVTDNAVPPGGAGKWARRVSAHTVYQNYLNNVPGYSTPIEAGYRMSEQIAGMLDAPSGPLPIPDRVIIDELRTKEDRWQVFNTMFAACADNLRDNRPQYAGRWGCFVEHPNASIGYANLAFSIDKLLVGGAFLACEMYASQLAYCPANRRDPWLRDYFNGSAGLSPTAGFTWLNQRKASLNSSSRLTAVFAVTSEHLNGPNAFKFLDRMFFVWRNYSNYPSAISYSNGGVGSYVWEPPLTPSSNLDAKFKESYDHYIGYGGAWSSNARYTVDC